MSGFNSFLGGATAGQDAYQQRQSAFNAAMMAGDEGGVSVPRQRGENIGPAFGRGERGGGAPDLAAIFGGLDPAKRQEVKADLSRKGQIVGVLAGLPAEQQVIGIHTYGKEFGIDETARARAAANPAAALAEVSSSIQQAEALLKQVGPQGRPIDRHSNALGYDRAIGRRRAEMPATLVAQVAEGQPPAADPYEQHISHPQILVNPVEPLGSLSQDDTRRLNSADPSAGAQFDGALDKSEGFAKEPDVSFDIGNIAKSAEEAYDSGYGEGYTYAQPEGRFGAKTNKCNLFVSDMVKAAGAKVAFNVDKDTGIAWEPRAADWANTKKDMEGWIFVKTPKRGDVVAQRRDYETASGHVAIVTRDADQDGYYRTVSAGTDGVQEESSALSFPSFKPGVDVGPVVFRRYVGVK